MAWHEQSGQGDICGCAWNENVLATGTQQVPAGIITVNPGFHVLLESSHSWCGAIQGNWAVQCRWAALLLPEACRVRQASVHF
jgi:hypothetical protein